MKELLLRHKTRFGVFCIASLLPSISQILMFFALSKLIATAEIGTLDAFKSSIAFSVVFILLAVGLQVASRFMRIGFIRDMLLEIRLKAFDRIMSLNLRSFRKNTKEVYMSHLINDINIIESKFFHRLLNIIFLGGTYVLGLAYLFYLDWKIALAMFLGSLILMRVVLMFEKKTVEKQKKVSTENEKYTVKMSNTFNGLELIKLSNIEKHFLTEAASASNKVEKKRLELRVFTEVQRTISMLIALSMQIGVIVYMIMQLSQGLDLDRMLLITLVAGSTTWPITNIGPHINELKSTAALYNKITHLDPEDIEDSLSNSPFIFKDSIRATNLSFEFEGKRLFQNANFSIGKGKKYLIKGASGTGKSTLMRILSKTISPTSGELYIDGVSLNSISIQDFNKNVAFIDQDVFLFEDTLKNNISLYGDYTDEEIRLAAKKAGLNDLLEANSLDLMLEENGKNLSGGQRQRISIARAIIRKAQILFADEATSSLNKELGRSVERSLLSLDTTVIAISHRYYEGISELYDEVLEIKGERITSYKAGEYFKNNTYKDDKVEVKNNEG